MDICLAKQEFPFDDPVLRNMTRHLGGGASILRIGKPNQPGVAPNNHCGLAGGSDQNNFYYDIASTRSTPFSRSTGKQCCTEHSSCHGCAKDCTMPAGYWKAMVDFAQSTGHRFVFGLVPEVVRSPIPQPPYVCSPTPQPPQHYTASSALHGARWETPPHWCASRRSKISL